MARGSTRTLDGSRFVILVKFLMMQSWKDKLGAVAIWGWFGVSGLILLTALLFFPGDDRGCSNIEFKIQEASRCVAFPYMWSEWSRLKNLYGTADFGGASSETCPKLIENVTRLGIATNQLKDIGHWTDSNNGGPRMYWKRQLGLDFCADADTRKWLQPPKAS